MVAVLGAVVVSVTPPVSGMSTSTSYWVALGIVVVFLLILYFVCGTVQYTDSTGQPQKVRGFWYLILGTDRRVSTSKVQLVLWTIALSYAILVIILHLGRFTASELQPSYLLLLGFPAGAAAGAKAITTSKAAAGTIDKTKPTRPRRGSARGSARSSPTTGAPSTWATPSTSSSTSSRWRRSRSPSRTHRSPCPPCRTRWSV